MLNFKHLLPYWQTAQFSRLLKQQLKILTVNELPLQAGLSHSSMALDRDIEVIILRMNDADLEIEIKASIFYKGVIAGCNCADDPSPIDENEEYCEILININQTNGNTFINLIDI